MMFVSEFTLALMEDSGWYKVDYNYSEPYFFGHGEGCDWFTEDCVDKTTQTSNFEQYFCHDSTDDGCSHNYDGVAYCYWGTGFNISEREAIFRYYVCN